MPTPMLFICFTPAGKSPGKEVFLRKRRARDGHQWTTEELDYYQERHLELEKKFLKAVLRTAINSSVKVREILEVHVFMSCNLVLSH